MSTKMRILVKIMFFVIRSQKKNPPSIFGGRAEKRRPQCGRRNKLHSYALIAASFFASLDFLLLALFL